MVILIASMLFKRVDISVWDKKIISNFQCAEIGEWSIFIKSNIFATEYERILNILDFSALYQQAITHEVTLNWGE